MINWNNIASAISDATQSQFSITQAVQLGGDDSNQAWKLSGLSDFIHRGIEIHYFVKLNAAQRFEMFAAESAGLTDIATTNTVRVPQSITHGLSEQHSYLVLEYLDLHTQGNSTLLGTQLVALHRNYADYFGWSRDNTIGVTPQRNNWSADWITFWREQRLGFQLNLLANNGYGGKIPVMGKQILDALPELFYDYSPRPSLLHGDLWGGNHGFLTDGTPVIFDPATYYGDREADIAMTELFGGYTPEFYSAYQQAYPLSDGYASRKTLYNLYHILNHCNMVSSVYLSQAEKMMLNLLGKLRQ